MNRRLELLESSAERTARLLGEEHGIQVVIGTKCAFDLKGRVLEMPAFEALPIEVADVWRGILDHEIAHAKYTDLRPWERASSRLSHGARPRVHMLWNAFEDLMIERRWLEKYPGSVRHFAARNAWIDDNVGSIREVSDPGWCGSGATPIGALGALVQTVVRWDGIDFSEIHPATAATLRAFAEIVERGMRAPDTAAAVAAAVELWEALNEEEEEKEEERPAFLFPPPLLPEAEEAEAEEAEGGGAEGGGAEGGGAEGEVLVPSGTEAESSPTKPLTKPPIKVPPPVVADLLHGRFGELGRVEAQRLIGDFSVTNRLPYNVHPLARRADKWIDETKSEPTPIGLAVRKAIESKSRRLTQGLANAILASRRSLSVASESGDELGDVYADIAARTGRRDLYTRAERKVAQSTYVVLLVDCSGSMGWASRVHSYLCSEHGASRDAICPTCGRAGVAVLTAKSQHAMACATAVHLALRAARVPHAVLGFTSDHAGTPSCPNPRKGRYLQWSRLHTAIHMFEFVASPGRGEGHGLGKIDGHSGNPDGEAVLEAAKYAAKHGKPYDRVIEFVISDGLPQGIDDEEIEGPYLKEAVERVAQAGIEIYGIGVGISERAVFATYYPNKPKCGARAATGHILLDNGEVLTETVIQALVSTVAGSRGTTRRGR